MSETLPPLRALAPAKINLGLFVGPLRDSDHRHELVSVMQSISLADELTLRLALAGTDADEVVCPGVAGPVEENLAARALRAFRERTGWDAPALRLEILKRIPVAAGLAGGSADAAATLRLAAAASGLADEQLLRELAGALGADVPAQLSPGRWLARGAGELLEALPAPASPFGVLVVPAGIGLATGEVFAEADRLAPARGPSELEARASELREALARGEPLPHRRELLCNDLEAAALSLHGELAHTLEQVRATDADAALVSGSGPTVLGLYAGDGEPPPRARLAAAAAALASRRPAPLCALPVQAGLAAPTRVDSAPAGTR